MGPRPVQRRRVEVNHGNVIAIPQPPLRDRTADALPASGHDMRTHAFVSWRRLQHRARCCPRYQAASAWMRKTG